MSLSATAELEVVRTQIQAIEADKNAQVKSYGIEYVRQRLETLYARESQLSAQINRRNTGMLTYADRRGSI